jgi:hypothetical protein
MKLIKIGDEIANLEALLYARRMPATQEVFLYFPAVSGNDQPRVIKTSGPVAERVWNYLVELCPGADLAEAG